MMRMAPHGGGEWEVAYEREPKGFWHALDWWGAAATALVALVVYLVTLAPGVTTGDSGELATAAWWFGVPHSTGYPAWTLIAWAWTHMVPVGNVAWRTNLLSAFWGALAAGLLALLVSRSGRVLAAKLISHEESFQHRLPLRVGALSGPAAGLLLAFGPAFWSQAVVTGVHTMNVCVWMAILVGLYRWSFETDRRWRLYMTAFLWGMGWGVHPTMILACLALAFFVWRVDRSVGRDLLVVALGIVLLVVVATVVLGGRFLRQGLFSSVALGGVGMGALVVLYFLCRAGNGVMQQWRVVLMVAVSVCLGVSWYLYEPLAAATNPPVNGGIAGLLQSVAGLQYALAQAERSLLHLWAQINVFFHNLQGQFNVVFAVLGLAVWFFFRELTRFSRDWLWFLLMAFLSFGLGFVFLSNPPFEKLRTLTDRVFFLPAYAVYAIFIGYSLILLQVFLLRRRVDVNPRAELWSLATLVFPVVSLLLYWAESSQRHHTFGYGYGYRIFKPEGAYPEMERNAVLFGGTTTGRCVPAYMVFVESRMPSFFRTHLPRYRESVIFDRRDVYVIAQGALNDPWYLRQLHARYGAKRSENSGWQRFWKRDELYPTEPLWLPSRLDWQEALRRSLAVLGGAGNDLAVGWGRLGSQNSAIRNELNGVLSRMLFEQNKGQHPFYVEEGDVIPWMYPYLEPYGLILRLQSQPVMVLDPSIVGRDRRFWDEQVASHLADPGFRQDHAARLAYSKARTAIAGLYAYHRMTEDAEYAFRQALQLYPDNQEAAGRFVQFYLQMDRFKEAQQVLTDALARDKYNIHLHEMINQLKEQQRVADEVRRLEALHQAQPSDIAVMAQLLAGYARRQQVEAMDGLVGDLLAQPHVKEDDLLQAADVYAGIRRLDRAAQLLKVAVHRFPGHAGLWYHFAAACCAQGNCHDGLNALSRAFALDPTRGKLRENARTDRRFDRCRQEPLFQQAVAPR